MFLTCFSIGIWNHGPILVHIVIWANTFSAIFFSNVFKISHFLGYGHFGFQHFVETKIMVSVVDCVAAKVMSLGFSADFMWLNKLKTSEKARVFHTLMTYLWDAKILLFLCKKSLRMPFFSSQNALFNGKTVAIRVKICIVSSGLHSWDKIIFEETFLFYAISSIIFLIFVWGLHWPFWPLINFQSLWRPWFIESIQKVITLTYQRFQTISVTFYSIWITVTMPIWCV